MAWTANRDLYLDAGGRQVEGDHPGPLILLARAGDELTDDQIAAHKVAKKARRKTRDKAAEQPENKSG